MEVIIDGVRYVPESSGSELVTTSGRWDQALADLEDDHPTGAWGMSQTSAAAQVSMGPGIAASIKCAQAHPPKQQWIDTLKRVAGESEIPFAVLLAISSRESYHGHLLDSLGEGDRGHAFGVMQVDKRYHSQRGRPNPYSYEHALQSSKIFNAMLLEIIRKHPDWPDKYLLKGACVAYNSGVRNVATIERMDIGTTGNDYGADVTARAKYYDTQAF